MQRVKGGGAHFACQKEVPQIRPRTGRARVAVTRGIGRPVVLRVPGVLDVDANVAREQLAVSRVARRQDAIEEIDAVGDRVDEVRRRAGAHQVSRPIIRQAPRRPGPTPVHHVHRLADDQATHCIRLEADLDRPARAFLAQRRVHAALHDAELRLSGIAHRHAGHQPIAKREKTIARSTRPPERPLHRMARRRFVCRMREAFVEHHRDVRSELRLHVGRLFRCQRVRRTVEMRPKMRAVLVDGAAGREAEHRIPAAVGEDRPRPAHEAMEAAASGNQIVPGPKREVVGVAEQDLRAERFEIAMRDALHRALRGNRHERRRVDDTVGRGDPAAPRASVGVCHLKVEGHVLSLACGKTPGRHRLRRTVQGLLELANVPYVGAGVLASAVGMDKAVMKLVFAANRLPICDYEVVLKRDWQRDERAILQKVVNRLGFPVFVKPANLGSSVGISKAKHVAELRAAIKLAAEFDRKIVIEAAVSQAREIEVAVLGNDEPEASVPGEIITSREFYDYEAKYISEDSRTLIPAPLDDAQAAGVRALAIAAFKAIDGAGMARVDFLLAGDSQVLYLNEVNTIPGFTTISMYSKMWDASGLPYAQLLDRLIALAIDRHAEKQQLRTSM